MSLYRSPDPCLPQARGAAGFRMRPLHRRHRAALTSQRSPDSLQNHRKTHDNQWEHAMGGILQRDRELKRRRHRKKKLKVFKRRLTKATASEKAHIATKIRRLTP